MYKFVYTNLYMWNRIKKQILHVQINVYKFVYTNLYIQNCMKNYFTYAN